MGLKVSGQVLPLRGVFSGGVQPHGDESVRTSEGAWIDVVLGELERQIAKIQVPDFAKGAQIDRRDNVGILWPSLPRINIKGVTVAAEATARQVATQNAARVRIGVCCP